VESAETGGEEAAIEFGIFVGEKAFAAAAHLGRVFSDPIKDAAANDSVSTHKIAGKGWGKETARLGIDDADYGVIAGRKPVWLGSLPIRKIGAAYELGLAIGKLAGDDLIPMCVDLFIVVDESDEITMACIDASVSCIGEALLGFFDIDDGPFCVCLNLADDRLGIVLAVVVDDDDGYGEAGRDLGFQEAGDG
jgi:hypothetical protein